MSQNANGLILSNTQQNLKMSIIVKFEVFTKMSSLSRHLAIQMLQIVIKQNYLYLYIFWEEYLFSAHFLRWLSAEAHT